MTSLGERSIRMAGCAFLGGAAVLLVLAGRAAEPPGPKVFQKRLKVASVDPATSTISVRESDLEVLWNGETRFLVHRSIRLKDLKRGKPLHILAKLHTVRTTVTAQTDSAMTEVAFLGTGEAYEHPPLTPQKQFVRWHAGTLSFVGPAPYLRIGDVMHRLSL